MAAMKVKEEENTTLEEDQKREVDLRIAEGRKKVLGGLVTAYNQVHKYVAAEGLQTLELRNFTDSFRQQISGTLMEVLKEEEWLLDSVGANMRSEEHTSELQSRGHLVCRLLLEKKNR